MNDVNLLRPLYDYLMLNFRMLHYQTLELCELDENKHIHISAIYFDGGDNNGFNIIICKGKYAFVDIDEPVFFELDDFIGVLNYVNNLED